MKSVLPRSCSQLAELCKKQPRLARSISLGRLGVANDITSLHLNDSDNTQPWTTEARLERVKPERSSPHLPTHCNNLDDHLHNLFTSTAGPRSIAASSSSSKGPSDHDRLRGGFGGESSRGLVSCAASANSQRTAVPYLSDEAGGYLSSDLANVIPDQIWTSLGERLRQPDTITSEDLWRSCKHAISNCSREALHPEQLRTLHNVLKSMCRADVLRDHDFTVAPSAVIRYYEEHGLYSHWHSASIWTLLARALQAKYDLTTIRNDQVTTLLEVRCVMSEILKIWGLYWPGRSSGTSIKSSVDEQRDAIYIPSEFLKSDGLHQFPKQLAPRFHACLDRIGRGIPDHKTLDTLKLSSPTEQMKSLAAAAAMTRDCFVPSKEGVSLQDIPGGRNYKNFMIFLDAIVHEVQSVYQVAYHQLSNVGLAPNIIEGALRSWRGPTESHPAQPKKRAVDKQLSRRPLLKESSGSNEVDTISKQRIVALTSTLDDAVKGSNVDLAESIWNEVQETIGECDRDQDDSHRIEKLYIALLSAFFALKRAETATEVWNHLVRKGHTPNKVHWTAMLHGCIKAHDPASLQEIWARMLKSNVIPDTATWTTYIRGLIKCRRWKEGINALDQLGRAWSRPSRSKVSSRPRISSSVSKEPGTEVLKPSIAPVNAALDALIDIGKSDLLQPLLAWASTYQVYPDTHTYNILLRPLVRKGNSSAIADHLSAMSTAGCPPDIATFTIIISSLVSSDDFTSRIPQDQERIILKFLEDMHSANVHPNTYTYSTLLTKLLSPPSSNRKHQPTIRTKTAAVPSSQPPANMSVVHTILAHMHASSIPPTPHIYTILLGHYFSLQPPQLEDVRSLWRSICALPPGSKELADPIFYDRMIEGLTAAGAVEEALNFLQTAVSEGKMLSWVALRTVLEGLEKAKDYSNLSWLVREVEREGGLMKWGQREIRGKDSFFRKVESLRAEGLLLAKNENAAKPGPGIPYGARR